MISLVTVNWNSNDFLSLLIESVERFTTVPYELIVVDNSLQKCKVDRVVYHHTNANIGHGAGLNLGVGLSNSEFPYVMFLDVDTHFLCHNWSEHFIKCMGQWDVVGGRGVPAKPIRPACMFMKRQFSKYDWRDSPGYKGHRITPDGTDVAIQAYYDMLRDGVRIGFLENKDNRYGTHTGEEWCIDDVPLVYHHWSGTWLHKRQEDFPEINLQSEKNKLFESIPWRLP